MAEPGHLELVKLTKRYGATVAVDSIDLRVGAGSYCCLLGPSGCGKTSTLRMIAGHESASEGDILIGAANVTDLPPAKRGTAMMFQSYALFPHLSCLDNVAFSLKMRGVDKATRRAQGDGVPQTGRHGHLRPARPGAIVGRTAAARRAGARADHRAADPAARRAAVGARSRSCACACARNCGACSAASAIPFVHVTHGQDEALALADLVVVMNKGRIEQAGPPREVFEAPATEFVARFLGGHNVISTPGGLIAVRADRTSLTAPRDPSARLAAVVASVEYQGASYQIGVEGGGAADLSAIVSDAVFARTPFAVGDSVGLAWNDADIHPLSPAS